MRDNSKANALLCRGRWGRLLSPIAAAGYSGCSSVEEFRSLYGNLIYNTNNRERVDIYELDAQIEAEKNAARHCG
jgi:hypothetical protein